MSKSIRLSRTGGPEVLEYVDVEVGPPGPGEAQVRHHAVGLNFIDIYFRTGLYPTALPSGLGTEGAGVVTALGEGVTHLKVGVLRDVCFLLRRSERPLEVPTDAPEVVPVARFGDAAEALWARCAAELGTGTVRDPRYLNWRYAEHPDIPHLLLEARSGTELRGLAALRAGGYDPRLFSLLDWLVPFEDRATERALLARASAEGRARSLPFLAAWTPLALPLAQRWQEELGFFARGTPFQECYRAWGPGLGRRWLDEHWVQTMGDIDFF